MRGYKNVNITPRNNVHLDPYSLSVRTSGTTQSSEGSNNNNLFLYQ
jgi:hypothetical protein